MRIAKSILLLLILVLTTGVSCAAWNAANLAQQTVAPDALVAELYKLQKHDRGPFFQTKSRALVDKYFAEDLANLIWKDAVTSKGEVGALDGDPLYDAQDMEIKNFAIHSPKYEGGKADVVVSFENYGKKETLTFKMVKRAAAWKIEDIRYTDGRMLSDSFKD